MLVRWVAQSIPWRNNRELNARDQIFSAWHVQGLGTRPETILLLRAVQPFESLYLTRATNRLNESISSAFSLASSSSSNPLSLPASFTSSSRGTTIPTGNEGQTTARLIVNELDKVRFDPLLVKAVARSLVRGVDVFVTRCQGLVSHFDHINDDMGILIQSGRVDYIGLHGHFNPRAISYTSATYKCLDSQRSVSLTTTIKSCSPRVWRGSKGYFETKHRREFGSPTRSSQSYWHNRYISST